jgi:beta-glucosidase
MNHSRIARRLASMTLEEKCRLLSGASSWRTHAIPRLGIPAIKMSDGPNGVRGESHGTTRTPGVNIPTSIVVGASWDVHIAHQLGVLLGREARRKAVHVVLAPTVNLHRTQSVVERSNVSAKTRNSPHSWRLQLFAGCSRRKLR